MYNIGFKNKRMFHIQKKRTLVYLTRLKTSYIHWYDTVSGLPTRSSNWNFFAVKETKVIFSSSMVMFWNRKFVCSWSNCQHGAFPLPLPLNGEESFYRQVQKVSSFLHLCLSQDPPQALYDTSLIHLLIFQFGFCLTSSQNSRWCPYVTSICLLVKRQLCLFETDAAPSCFYLPVSE